MMYAVTLAPVAFTENPVPPMVRWLIRDSPQGTKPPIRCFTAGAAGTAGTAGTAVGAAAGAAAGAADVSASGGSGGSRSLSDGASSTSGMATTVSRSTSSTPGSARNRATWAAVSLAAKPGSACSYTYSGLMPSCFSSASGAVPAVMVTMYWPAASATGAGSADAAAGERAVTVIRAAAAAHLGDTRIRKAPCPGGI